MRRYLLTGVVLMFGISATFGHDSTKVRSKATPEQRAERYTKWMTKELTLSTEQQGKVKAVNLEAAKKMEEVKSAGYKDKKEKTSKVKAVQDERDSKLKPILTTEQWTRYEKAKEEQKARMKEKMKDKKKGKKSPASGESGDADLEDMPD